MSFFLILISFLLYTEKIYSIEELTKIYEEGISQWFDGRIEDAIGSFEYIVHNSTDDKEITKSGHDLITLLNEKGEPSLALAYADRILAIDKNNPYILFEKAYSLLLLNNFVKSKEALDEILTLTSDEDLIYFSQIIKSIVETEISGYEKPIVILSGVYRNYPPLIPISFYLAGRFSGKLKKMQTINFLKDCLVYDPLNIQALIDLATIYENTKYYIQAWQAYFTLREIEGERWNYFDEKAKKISKKINKTSDDLFLWSRLAWPVHPKPLGNVGTKNIRIALYTDKNKHQPEILSFYIIANTDFNVMDSILGKRYRGKKDMQYKFEYTKANRILEMKDNSQTILYATRNNFEIIPEEPGGIILIKSPRFNNDVFQVNRGDKEISGKLSVYISSNGLRIINHTYTEHIIPSIVSSINTMNLTQEALKSLIIVVRTILNSKKNPQQMYDITDQDDLIKFKGLQFEKEDIVKLTESTNSIILKKSTGEIYQASYSINTANIINKKPDPNSSFPKSLSPSSFTRYILFDSLKKPLYSTPSNLSELSNITWTVILDTKWIEERINTKEKIGKIKNIYILKRNNIGEVISIKVEGTLKDLIIEGSENVKYYLSGNTLRSNMFVIRKIQKGKFPDFFIIKGVGTGDFTGLCLYGANYLALNHGFDYRQILRYYFPDAIISKE